MLGLRPRRTIFRHTRLLGQLLGLAPGLLPGLLLGALSYSTPALAGDMDLAPERLSLQPSGIPQVGGKPIATCQTIAQNPSIVFDTAAGWPAGVSPNQFPCRGDNVAFRNLVAELGYALAPPAMAPARTTGYAGFLVTLDIHITKIHPDALSTATDGSKRSFWQDGTQGPNDPNSNVASVRNKSPDSALQLYSLTVRKGLPLGFELGASFGFLGSTSMWVVGGDLRFSPFEGFRTGVLGYLPDLSVGGGVRTLLGSSKVFVTTVGIDATISKPIRLADSSVLSPYFSYQRLITFADSSVVNFTPNVDPLRACGYQGVNPQTGAPQCANKLTRPDGSTVDNNSALNNYGSFDPVTVHRHRGILGLTYRYELAHLGSQIAFDLGDPSGENAGLVGGSQWTFSLQGGVAF